MLHDSFSKRYLKPKRVDKNGNGFEIKNIQMSNIVRHRRLFVISGIIEIVDATEKEWTKNDGGITIAGQHQTCNNIGEYNEQLVSKISVDFPRGIDDPDYYNADNHRW